LHQAIYDIKDHSFCGTLYGLIKARPINLQGEPLDMSSFRGSSELNNMINSLHVGKQLMCEAQLLTADNL
jgi:hypothetical protein